jgi:hypothetical protein
LLCPGHRCCDCLYSSGSANVVERTNGREKAVVRRPPVVLGHHHHDGGMRRPRFFRTGVTNNSLARAPFPAHEWSVPWPILVLWPVRLYVVAVLFGIAAVRTAHFATDMVHPQRGFNKENGQEPLNDGSSFSFSEPCFNFLLVVAGGGTAPTDASSSRSIMSSSTSFW